ncbi:hypothetical protein CYMTET_34801 [Cymbomonas tetramitiformis]|uniref:Uncharacterized protein n=1 Tax=Cymbomonas tetramitiformis TaxID=36881 RepID=A0AAE0FAF6_9CHLO|nr:hypothetical protein CYMTET_34801 [Cymbomonas tetramitiformis]
MNWVENSEQKDLCSLRIRTLEYSVKFRMEGGALCLLQLFLCVSAATSKGVELSIPQILSTGGHIVEYIASGGSAVEGASTIKGAGAKNGPMVTSGSAYGSGDDCGSVFIAGQFYKSLLTSDNKTTYTHQSINEAYGNTPKGAAATSDVFISKVYPNGTTAWTLSVGASMHVPTRMLHGC